MSDPMSDAIHTVSEYDDLAGVADVTDRQRTQIANTLSDGADAVVWLPEWIVREDDKDLAPIHAHPQLYVGVVADYSENALKVSQHDGGDYVPKSEAHAFRLGDGVDRIETPQSDLGSFGVEP